MKWIMQIMLIFTKKRTLYQNLEWTIKIKNLMRIQKKKIKFQSEFMVVVQRADWVLFQIFIQINIKLMIIINLINHLRQNFLIKNKKLTDLELFWIKYRNLYRIFKNQMRIFKKMIKMIKVLILLQLGKMKASSCMNILSHMRMIRQL